jgi:tetratricopeptide (TPR) repeat protein
MPFKKVGTDLYRHYRALFDSVMKPAIERFGYRVHRADDHSKSGAVTREVVEYLATADLVIADLTELNANVFYELGIRHALRGRGTIMVHDDTVTELPFNIATYRVIKFTGDLVGIGNFTNELAKCITEIQSGNLSERDNLVHDCLRELPENVLAHAKGASSAELQKEVRVLREEVVAYRQRLGRDVATFALTSSLDVIAQAISEAEAGGIPSALVTAAEEAAEQDDLRGFLKNVSELMQLKCSKPSSRQVFRLANAANRFGHGRVLNAILDYAIQLFPDDETISQFQTSVYAHSDDRGLRDRAREKFAKRFDIDMTTGTFRKPPIMSKRTDLANFAVMIDAFHRDGMDTEAFSLVKSLAEHHPDRSLVLRNLARAHERIGNNADAFHYFRAAALAPDADDQAAVWFGNELHNRGRHVDAAELYSLGCLRDPDDPAIFAHLADELAWAIKEQHSGTAKSDRRLPDLFSTSDFVSSVIGAALSCGQIDPETAERLKEAAKRVEFDLGEIFASLRETGPMERGARVALAKKVRFELETELSAIGANKAVNPSGASGEL